MFYFFHFNYAFFTEISEDYNQAILKRESEMNAVINGYSFELLKSLPDLLTSAILMNDSVFNYREDIAEERALILKIEGNGEYAHYGIQIKDGKYRFWEVRQHANSHASNEIIIAVLQHMKERKIQFNDFDLSADLKIL